MAMQSSQIEAQDRRNHYRFPLAITVRVEVGKKGPAILAQHHDISWGGVRLLVPRQALPRSGQIRITFPWAQGDQFSAVAEVVRTEPFDDQQDLVAARFSCLSTSDQRLLDKLLQMLQESGDDGTERKGLLVPVLEVLFSDPSEMRSKLAELAEGRLSVTVFERYELGQSIRLILGGTSDHKALRLRARVEQVTPVSAQADPTWPTFDLQLGFEHPLEELKSAAVVAFGMAWMMGGPSAPPRGEGVPSVARMAVASA